MVSSHTAEGDEKNQATVDIAQDGDVVFIIGQSRKRIKVHSLLLSNASPVFKAMLGPYFKEGRQLAQTGLAEVELPEDDPDNAEVIFNVIHGQNENVPESLGAKQLLEVATMTDKYDCVLSLAFAFESWLNYITTTDASQSWIAAMVALASSRPKSFAEATSALLLNHSGSYLDLTRNGPLLFLDMTMQLRTAGTPRFGHPTTTVCLTNSIFSNAGTGTRQAICDLISRTETRPLEERTKKLGCELSERLP
jgi:hypothetical protein